jgi:hypothetical protein
VGCSGTQRPEFVYTELPVIRLENGAVEIVPGTGVLDSPVLSADGERLAVQVEVYEDPVLPYEIYSLGVAEKDQWGNWGRVAIIREGVYRKWGGRMEMPIQPSFDDTGERLVLTQIEFDSILSIPSVGSVCSWVERIGWRGGEPEILVEHQDWGLRRNELIQHARVSPDGRWLAFYVRVHKATQGIYLLDLHRRRHYRLSEYHDKHPTWDPSGHRIYFHHVTGGARHRFDFFTRGQERAVIGYIELHLRDGRLVDWERHLMDELNGEFIYHKHPTEVAGRGLLFFHGRLKPEGKMKLMVRYNEPGSQIYVIEATCGGKKLKAVKHPCSSLEVADLVFIGKAKGSKDYSLLLALTDEALAEIRRVVGDNKSVKEGG